MSTQLLRQAAVATQYKYQLNVCQEADATERDLISERIAQLDLTPDEWVAFHRNHQPSAEWFDDDDCPFRVVPNDSTDTQD
jgi:hypothetical protein